MNDLTKAPLLNAWPRMNQNIQSEKPATNPARNQYFLPTVSQLFSKLKIKSGWSGVATIETNNIPITKDVQIFDGFCPRKVFTFSRLPDWEDGDAEGQIPSLAKEAQLISTSQRLNKSTPVKPPRIPSSEVNPCLHNEGMLSEDFRNLRQPVELKQLSRKYGFRLWSLILGERGSTNLQRCCNPLASAVLGGVWRCTIHK